MLTDSAAELWIIGESDGSKMLFHYDAVHVNFMLSEA